MFLKISGPGVGNRPVALLVVGRYGKLHRLRRMTNAKQQQLAIGLALRAIESAGLELIVFLAGCFTDDLW